jgi:hypothetical protein
MHCVISHGLEMLYHLVARFISGPDIMCALPSQCAQFPADGAITAYGALRFLCCGIYRFCSCLLKGNMAVVVIRCICTLRLLNKICLEYTKLFNGLGGPVAPNSRLSRRTEAHHLGEQQGRLPPVTPNPILSLHATAFEGRTLTDAWPVQYWLNQTRLCTFQACCSTVCAHSAAQCKADQA